MFYFRDKFFILVILYLSLLLYGCETTQLAPKKTLTYNQTQLLETIVEYEDPNVQENNLIDKDDKIFRLGLLLPLSGEFYQIGKSLLDSAQLAFWNDRATELSCSRKKSSSSWCLRGYANHGTRQRGRKTRWP